MKRICILVLLALVLTGCKTAYEIQPDTIVEIPLHPTGHPTEPATAGTEGQTEAMTRPPAPQVPTIGTAPPEDPTQPGGPPSGYDPTGYAPSRLDLAVAEEINARRQEAGMAPLVPDTRLCAIASVRAWENSIRWGHIRPDGRDGLTVLEEYGFRHAWAGENLYYGAGTAGAIVGRWMGAAATRETILLEAEAIGVGSYTGADGVTYLAVLITA